jgi:hypothetical protein
MKVAQVVILFVLSVAVARSQASLASNDLPSMTRKASTKVLPYELAGSAAKAPTSELREQSHQRSPALGAPMAETSFIGWREWFFKLFNDPIGLFTLVLAGYTGNYPRRLLDCGAKQKLQA